MDCAVSKDWLDGIELTVTVTDPMMMNDLLLSTMDLNQQVSLRLLKEERTIWECELPVEECMRSVEVQASLISRLD